MQSESEIVRAICDTLVSSGYFFWRSNNIPAPGRALPKYTPRGIPDIFVVHEGILVGIEVKRPGAEKDTDREANGRRVRAGLLSPDQAQFGNALRVAGGKYLVVTSVADLDMQLTDLGFRGKPAMTGA